jgi:hypothetical protein
MTNYDFACCNLLQENFELHRKKFKELVYGDKVYCICIWRSKGMNPSDILYEYEFKNAMMEGNSDENPKLRKAIFYLTDTVPYIGFKADIHKSGSIIASHIKKRQGEVYIRVYATTPEECIERAEKLYGHSVKNTLQHKIVK